MDIFSLLIGIAVGFFIALLFSSGDEKSRLGKAISNLEKLFDHYVAERTKVTHKWGKWEAFEEGQLADRFDNVSGRFVYLRRTCEVTGEQEIKKISSKDNA